MRNSKRNKVDCISNFTETLQGKTYSAERQSIPEYTHRSMNNKSLNLSTDRSADIDILYERNMLPSILKTNRQQQSIFSSTLNSGKYFESIFCASKCTKIRMQNQEISISNVKPLVTLKAMDKLLPESPLTSPRLLTIPNLRIPKKKNDDHTQLASILTNMIEKSQSKKHRLLRPCNKHHTIVQSTDQSINHKLANRSNRFKNNPIKANQTISHNQTDYKCIKYVYDKSHDDDSHDNVRSNVPGFAVIDENLRMIRKNLQREFIMGKWNIDSFNKRAIGSGLCKTTWIPTQAMIKYLEESNLDFEKVSRSFASSIKLYNDLCDLTFFRDLDIEDALRLFALGIVIELPSGWKEKYYENDRIMIVLRGLLEVSAPKELIQSDKNVWPKFTLQEGEGISSNIVSLMLGTDYFYGKRHLNLNPIGNTYVLLIPYSTALNSILKHNITMVDIWIKLHGMSSLGILCSDSIRLIISKSRLVKLTVATDICNIMTTSNTQRQSPYFSVIIRGRVEVSYKYAVPMKMVDMFGVEEMDAPDVPPETERVIEVRPGEVRKDLVRKRMNEIKGELAYPVIRVADGRLIQGYKLIEELYMYLDHETTIPANTPYTVTVTSDELFLLVIPIEIFKVLPQRELKAILKVVPIDDIPDSMTSAEA